MDRRRQKEANDVFSSRRGEVAKPSQKVVLIIRIDANLNTSEVAAISDASQRRVYIDRFYSKLKQSLVNGVKSFSSAQIVDRLDGTNQMVVQTPNLWRKYPRAPSCRIQERRLATPRPRYARPSLPEDGIDALIDDAAGRYNER